MEKARIWKLTDQIIILAQPFPIIEDDPQQVITILGASVSSSVKCSNNIYLRRFQRGLTTIRYMKPLALQLSKMVTTSHTGPLRTQNVASQDSGVLWEIPRFQSLSGKKKK